MELSGIDIAADQMDHQFLELGLDSLFLTQATQGLQKKFGVKLTFRQIMEQHSTIASLATYLDSVLPPDPSPVATQSQAVPLQSITSVATPSSAAGSAVERLFSEQLAMMTKVFEQQMSTLRVATGLSSIAPASAISAMSVASVAVPALAPAPVFSASETSEVKHGSYRPLQPRVQQDLDDDQQRYLSTLIAKYERRTSGSKRLTAKARPHLADPRAVAGFRPQWKEIVYPLVTERAKGSKIWGRRWE